MKYLLIILLSCTVILAENTDEIIKQIQEKYKKINSFQGVFRQVNIWSELNKWRALNGKIYVSEPNKLLLEYIHPKGQFLLSTGDFIYLYSPVNKQVMKFSTNKLEYGLRFKDLIYKYPEESDVTYVGSEKIDGRICKKLFLVPRNEKTDFVKMEIWVGTDSIIYRIAYEDDTESKIVYTFSDIIINPKLDSKHFEFRLPSGAKIIDKSE
ncbi:MAG: outer membrane lipoprotein carrier protein LolA [Candidatus Coatesbacteria bacterium]|nr:outer membrane lipoprotein carrier protein LolA [Candidatus Coatesbacteria bacterium]